MHTNDEIRFHLMERITQRIDDLGLTQTRAAELTGTVPSRFSEIKHYKANIGIDGLVSIMAGASSERRAAR